MVRSADLHWQAWNLQEELGQRHTLRAARAEGLRKELESLDALALRLARGHGELQREAAETSKARRSRRAGRRWLRLAGRQLRRASQVGRPSHLDPFGCLGH